MFNCSILRSWVWLGSNLLRGFVPHADVPFVSSLLFYSDISCSTTICCALWFGTALLCYSSTEQHNVARSITQHHKAVHSSTEQHSAAQNSTEQHKVARSTTQHHTAALSSIQQHKIAKSMTQQRTESQ
jgi:predicted DNA repair protein MutK